MADKHNCACEVDYCIIQLKFQLFHGSSVSRYVIVIEAMHTLMNEAKSSKYFVEKEKFSCVFIATVSIGRSDKKY